MWDGRKILRSFVAWLFASDKQSEAATITNCDDMKEEQAMGFPEMTSHNFHSYFFMPAVWIGQTPTQEERGTPFHVDPVMSRMLTNFIRIYVFRDGVFMFDFANWPEAAPVKIPAFDPAGGNKPPKAWDDAMTSAREHHYKATSVMNAHLACLNTALAKGQGPSVPVTQFITPDSYFTTHVGGRARYLMEVNLVKPREAWGEPYVETVEDRLGRPRIVLEEKTVKRSFELLDQILTSPVPETLLMTTLIYRAVINIREHDFATALTLAWTVCEKLLGILWERYFSRNGTVVRNDGTIASTLNKERRTTFKGRDFTASIISETLALAGEIPHETFLKLKSARVARNNWLHKTTPITSTMAFDAVRTAELMLKQVGYIDLEIQLSVSNRI